MMWIYFQGVSVDAVDPVFQAKMLDMLKHRKVGAKIIVLDGKKAFLHLQFVYVLK